MSFAYVKFLCKNYFLSTLESEELDLKEKSTKSFQQLLWFGWASLEADPETKKFIWKCIQDRPAML